jgi:hypothetical protein
LSKATTRETTVWRQMWKKPQAIVWEEQSSHRQVAMYVRTSVEAEEAGASASLRSLLLRQENALLLNHQALLSAGFRITTQQASAPTVSSSKPAAAGRQVPSSRGRLRAVEDVGSEE